MNHQETIKAEDFFNDEENFDTPESVAPDELDVQRTVVEALAAEKAELAERFAALNREKEAIESEKKKLSAQIESLRAEKEEFRSALGRMSDLLLRNTERPESNQISLIDRDVNIDDRFSGETRDHVLEVISEARDNAEKDGRRRRAQLLESVLVANEPVGELKNRRNKLIKLFEENGNIINGPVLEALGKAGISHKDGENFLLASEILKRNY